MSKSKLGISSFDLNMKFKDKDEAIKSIHIKTIIKHSIIIIILYFFIVPLFKVIYYFKVKLSIYKSINGFNFNIDLESIKKPADNL